MEFFSPYLSDRFKAITAKLQEKALMTRWYVSHSHSLLFPLYKKKPLPPFLLMNLSQFRERKNPMWMLLSFPKSPIWLNTI